MAITTATYTAPITWSAFIAFTIARANNFVGTGPAALGGNFQWLQDNINYSMVLANLWNTAGAPGNWTRAGGTTLAAVDTTNLRMSFTSNLPKIFSIWQFQAGVDDTAHNTQIGDWSTLLDGVTSDNGNAYTSRLGSFAGAALAPQMLTMITYNPAVPAGAHTLDLAWKNNNLAGMVQTVYGGAGGPGAVVRAMCWEAR